MLEEFEDSEGVIRIRKSKNRQHNGQQELEAQWAERVSLTFHSALRTLNTEPSRGASYQISVHLATQFQRRRLFKNRPIRNKNYQWWSCLLADRD